MAKMWTIGDTFKCLSVENIVGKGEIARHEQFLLFPQCFQKQFDVDVLNWLVDWLYCGLTPL